MTVETGSSGTDCSRLSPIQREAFGQRRRGGQCDFLALLRSLSGLPPQMARFPPAPLQTHRSPLCAGESDVDSLNAFGNRGSRLRRHRRSDFGQSH